MAKPKPKGKKKKPPLLDKKPDKKPEIKLQSEYYPLMKLATIAVLIIVIISTGAIIYGLINFYGIDVSGQITTAATAVENITPANITP